jgi:hypothetical protein
VSGGFVRIGRDDEGEKERPSCARRSEADGIQMTQRNVRVLAARSGSQLHPGLASLPPATPFANLAHICLYDLIVIRLIKPFAITATHPTVTELPCLSCEHVRKQPAPWSNTSISNPSEAADTNTEKSIRSNPRATQHDERHAPTSIPARPAQAPVSSRRDRTGSAGARSCLSGAQASEKTTYVQSTGR